MSGAVAVAPGVMVTEPLFTPGQVVGTGVAVAVIAAPDATLKFTETVQPFASVTITA